MAVNPMQRQKRVSFLLGMLTMLLVAAIIIGVLGMQLVKMKQKEKEEKQSEKQVYVLNTDLSSGQEITTGLLEMKTVRSDMIPSNAYGDLDILTSYSLTDKDGNAIVTEIENGKTTGYLYVQYGDQKTYIERDSSTNKYYKLKGKNSGERDGEIELSTVPLVAKVNMKKNTVLTQDLIAKSDAQISSDVRMQEYNMFTLPSTIQTGDFVDVRLRLSSGVDYIVVSKKQVTIPQIAGVDAEDTVNINLTEDEILTLSNAIVEAYMTNGSEIYVSVYTDPGMQTAAVPTYPVNAVVYNLIRNNPNIVDEAKQALASRYQLEQRNDVINTEIQKNADQADSDIDAGIKDHITKQKELRQKYIDALAGTTIQ